jgi:hypothetical protein
LIVVGGSVGERVRTSQQQMHGFLIEFTPATSP